LALNPGSDEAQSQLANALVSRVADGNSDSVAADIERAKGLVTQVLAASPHNPIAHLAKAQLLRTEDRYEEAIPEYETVIALNRNVVRAYRNLAICKFWTGAIEESIALEEQAIRLSPRDPLLGVMYKWIGSAHLLQSRLDDAIVWFEKARSDDAGSSAVHAYLASAYALKGDLDRAYGELAEARRLAADNRFSSIARLNAVGFTGSGYWGVPKIRALFEATFFAGLRKAGMPEE
jgi:adenylate cyclase